MMDFLKNDFLKHTFSKEQISNYFNSSIRDYDIAKNSPEPMVIFTFTYNAIIKAGIALIATYGYRVRSAPGHHIKLLQKMKEILGKEYSLIIEIFNDMRRKRNTDLYGGGIYISEKDANEYLELSKTILDAIREYIK